MLAVEERAKRIVETAIELAEEGFRMPVRLGLPKYVGGLSEVVRSPVFSTGIGLVLFAHQNRNKPKASRTRITQTQDAIHRAKDWLLDRFGNGAA